MAAITTPQNLSCLEVVASPEYIRSGSPFAVDLKINLDLGPNDFVNVERAAHVWNDEHRCWMGYEFLRGPSQGAVFVGDEPEVAYSSFDNLVFSDDAEGRSWNVDFTLYVNGTPLSWCSVLFRVTRCSEPWLLE